MLNPIVSRYIGQISGSFPLNTKVLNLLMLSNQIAQLFKCLHFQFKVSTLTDFHERSQTLLVYFGLLISHHVNDFCKYCVFYMCNVCGEPNKMWMGEFDSNTQGVDEIFLNPQQKISGLKNIRIRVDGGFLNPDIYFCLFKQNLIHT